MENLALLEDLALVNVSTARVKVNPVVLVYRDLRDIN